MKVGGGGGRKETSFLLHHLPALLLAPFFARSLTLVPRSLLLNRTETLATQANLIVTTKPDLINRKGVLPLEISDYCLIYTTLNPKYKRPPPKMINVRKYKQFQVDQFQADITAASFHVARVFEDKDDVLWAWNKLFKDICDLHAPTKRVKIWSQS